MAKIRPGSRVRTPFGSVRTVETVYEEIVYTTNGHAYHRSELQLVDGGGRPTGKGHTGNHRHGFRRNHRRN